MKPPPAGAAFAAAFAAIATFSAMDALMKGLTLELGVYNAALWRTAGGVLLSGALHFARRPARPSARAMRLHVERGLVSTLMIMLFFWGLARTPMAQAVALTFIAPLLALALAASLLGETVGRHAVAASAVAFAGVIVIVIERAAGGGGRGGAGLLGTLAILGSAVCYAYNIILMRRQAQASGPVEVAFYQSLTVGGVLLLAAPWLAVLPARAQLAPLGAAAALAIVSLMLFSWAYARAEANRLATTEYTGFLWASLFGWAVFGETVGPATLLGAALIVAGCIVAARGGARPAPPIDAEL